MRKESTLTNSKLAKTIGERIARRRKALGFKQAQFAELVNVEPETISRVERGASIPSLQSLISYADALNTELIDLLKDLPTKKTAHSDEWQALSSSLTATDRVFVLKIMNDLVVRLKTK
jgi:transcriptional regulator with XRE-family HTH domain